MNKLKEIINSDIYRYYGTTKLPFLWKIKDHTLYLQIIYRKAHFYRIHNKKIRYAIYEMKNKKNSIKYSFNVSSKTEIGYGLALTHNGTYNINSEAKIGNNCNISCGVNIGRENRGKREGCPTIGNNVWIGTNAVIVGKVIIGDNVLIAPNSFVNFDVPSNSIVIGNPAIVKNSESATNYYINNIYEERK